MASTRIQVMSDLHLESPAAYDVFKISPKAPFLALLGDIGYVQDDGFFPFLRNQLASFKIVFLVLGNHEPYHSSWVEAKANVKRFEAEIDEAIQKGETLGKLVLLDQTRYDISETVTVLGCTLFSRIAGDQMDHVNFGLNDFYLIGDWSVEAHNDAHLADLTWLNEQVASISTSEPNRKIVVFTHYCPVVCDKVIDPKFAGSKISSGFMTNLACQKCWESEAVKIWAFGHTHWNCEFTDMATGKTVMANQRGYYFAQSAGFDEHKVVEIQDC
ncbi:uncharacterized protein DSM5745_05077 [Aspergillus mulundensis]|uniref:Calcineurin-like phosphoesterase domain-containing protein n=1 Tax=Aspergillus mulundensis TaxID=1810919 RepID=A0A3D8S5P3_9EURO|nr:hypothetical protein DSM5745_05077 [Aspergillus mulundensis]RDW81520.1 hypothetical protein DSM5745_05077 [Aspergillus mulundensis]